MFLMNVSTLPLDKSSAFIRTFFTSRRFVAGKPVYEVSIGLDPIEATLAAFRRGDIRSFNDLRLRSRLPAQ